LAAQAVWPAVNETALARAFNGLESQTLTFDDCDVRVSGEAAWATCRGSARYVPKVGSRDPRTESRTWTFTLKKAGELHFWNHVLEGCQEASVWVSDLIARQSARS